MHLTGLTDLLRGSPVYQTLLDELNAHPDRSISLIRAARPYLLAALARDWQGPLVFVTPHVKRAYNISEQLPVWLGDEYPVMRFAEPTSQFYERTSWVESVVRNRLETLAALMPPDDTAVTQQPLIITSAKALMQRTLPVNQFRRASLLLKIGERQSIDKLLMACLGMGYEAVPLVVEAGTFSRRGGIVDIFPIAANLPVRIEFFGDEIDTMRTFDPASQRSEGQLTQVAITPAREALPTQTQPVATHLSAWFESLQAPEDDMTSASMDAEPLANGVPFPYLEHYLPYLYPNPVSLLDYTPPDALIIIEDMDDLRDAIDEIQEQAATLREEQIRAGQLPSDYPLPYVEWETLQAELSGRTLLQMSNAFQPEQSTRITEAFGRIFEPGGRYGGQLRPVVSAIHQLQSRGSSVVVVSQQTTRLADVWYEQEADFVPISMEIEDTPQQGSLRFVTGALQEGWTLKTSTQELHLFTDAEIFGWSRPEPRRRKSGKVSRPPESNYADWNEGDFVVHVDYGIGQFVGMRHRTIEGNEREYLTVQYGGTDMIFVPIHQADRLTKYVGATDAPPVLSKLGQPEWARIKSRASKAVEEEAEELLALYAARAGAQGVAYSPDNHWQHELEASFPYVETEDQLRAVRDVKADMEALHPMDRLICGDVGYGKTEVALRAAFKAVMDGKQVAVLVPTTVLAQQHYETFSRRLEAFPLKVEVMSRFRSKEQLNQVTPKIAGGEVDVVIGTHRILSGDVTFKDLGLVIIDEEQRFGVKHKEHFKQLRNHVDVLTLTATPIPRTLYMGLAGVRDISMIQTPPEERLPIITYVGSFDSRLIRQSILREIERGGQVFVVHNRVKSIDNLSDKIQGIVPEARITVAHGQMSPRQLESIMASFAHGEFDVLISTSIIESGIDIPNVNTLIVDRADWFGMAQLYQLRGRVGRSAQQAYAYFFHGGTRRLTEEAKARLDTLAENTSLGAGFQIAMRDLEIRGAGDILSTRQTGHVSAIGLHLYTQLLTDAIQNLKGKADDEPVPAAATSSIVIDLPIPAYLPNDWIPEIALRLQIYRRIASINLLDDVIAMREELRDRFGILPRAVSGLLYQMEVKLLAQAANATHVMGREGKIQIKLPYLGEINRQALEHRLGEDVSVSRTAVMLDNSEHWQERLREILSTLAQGVNTGVGI